MKCINLDQWIAQILSVWQSLGEQSVWLQDGFLLLMCLLIGVLLFLFGTVIGLFVQSLWGIFTAGRHSDGEHK
ncbi:hypothetical protein [Methylophilus sp. 3sh_L]|jgi:vacuolar-type H+-ATPase subunit I/STV1|uniref:hypothetical protein n=1 Tax=Methylophilus sp. 3sh_L TaxID=3377114 RepID=UPI00398E6DD0